MFRKICDQMAPVPDSAVLHVKEFVKVIDRKVGNFAKSDFALGLDRRVEAIIPKKGNVYLAVGIASIATVALAILFDHSPEAFTQFKDFWKDHGVTVAELGGVAAATMLSALIGKKTAGHQFDRKDFMLLVGIVAVTVVATLIAGDQTHVNTSAKFADFFTQEWKPLLIAGGFAALATALMKLSKHWRNDPNQRPAGIFVLACSAVALLYAGIHNFNDLEHLVQQHRVAVFVGASSFAAFTAFILQYMQKKMSDEETEDLPSLYGRVIGTPQEPGGIIDTGHYDPSDLFAVDTRPALSMDLSGHEYHSQAAAVAAPVASGEPLMFSTAQEGAGLASSHDQRAVRFDSQPHEVAPSPASPAAMTATPDEPAVLAAAAAAESVSVLNGASGAPIPARGPATTGRTHRSKKPQQRYRDTSDASGVDVKVPV